jgi:iron complex transport system substrate-binding protein
MWSDAELSQYGDTYSLPPSIEQPPRRVVSLVPSMTESLFDLQLGDRLVGVTDYCIYPEQGVKRLPKVGGTKSPRVEQIIALQPDLVLMNKEENQLEDAQALEAAGLTVWVTEPRTVQEALNLLWEIMSIFDEPVMSERVRWIERQMDWAAAAARENEPTRVFVPIWYAPWMTFNRDTYMHDLLRVCGGQNVFASHEQEHLAPLHAVWSEGETPPADDPRAARHDTRYPCVTLAEIAATQPEVVLLPSEPYRFTEAHAQEIAALDIPAAHNGRIHLVDGTLLTWHGTRIAYALSELPSLLSTGKEA